MESNLSIDGFQYSV